VKYFCRSLIDESQSFGKLNARSVLNLARETSDDLAENPNLIFAVPSRDQKVRCVPESLQPSCVCASRNCFAQFLEIGTFFRSCDKPTSALLGSLILSGYDQWDRRQLPALDDGNKALNVYH
jgi:hypothetical protein